MKEFKNSAGGEMIYTLVRSFGLLSNMILSACFSFFDLEIRKAKICFLGDNLSHAPQVEMTKNFMP